MGGKFHFLSLHKTLCFCWRHDGLFVGVNVLEVYLWHGHSMPLTHSPCMSLYHWPHRAKCYAAVTNNCWARRWRHRVSWCVSIPMSQKCYVSECHNPCHEVWHCVSCVIIVTLKHYTLLQLSARDSCSCHNTKNLDSFEGSHKEQTPQSVQSWHIPLLLRRHSVNSTQLQWDIKVLLSWSLVSAL